MTDPNRPSDDTVKAAQAGEPVVSKPYIMPDDPEEGSMELLVKEATESRDKMLRTLAEMENLRKRTAREVADARARCDPGRGQGDRRSRHQGLHRRRRADRALAAQHAGEERRQEVRSVGREV